MDPPRLTRAEALAKARATRQANQERAQKLREERIARLQAARERRNRPEDLPIDVPTNELPIEPPRKLTRTESLAKARAAKTAKRSRSQKLKEQRSERLRAFHQRRREERQQLQGFQDNDIPTDEQTAYEVIERFQNELTNTMRQNELFSEILEKLSPTIDRISDEGVDDAIVYINTNPTATITFNYAQSLEDLVPDELQSLYRLMLTPQASFYRYTLRQHVYASYAEALRKIRTNLLPNLVAQSRFAHEGKVHMVTPAYIAFMNGQYDNIGPDSHILPYKQDEEITQENMYTIFPPEAIVSFRRVTKRTKSNRRKAGWAPWVNKLSFLNLNRYQIDTAQHDLSKEEAKEHCLIYALRKSKQVSDDVLQALSMEIYGHNLTFIALRQLCNKFNISLKVTDYEREKPRTLHFGPRDKEIWLGVLDEHFFINETLWISDWVLNNPAEAEHTGNQGHLGWHYKKDGEFILADPNHTRTVGDLLRKMKALNHLIPIPADDATLLSRNYYTMKHISPTDLSYPEQACTPILPRSSEANNYTLFFADFETTTDGDQHLPYMLCCVCENGQELTLQSYETTADNVKNVWTKKLTRMMVFVSENTPPEHQAVVYFHNLNYDMAFIIPYIHAKNKFDVVEVNNRIIGFSVYCGVTGQMATFRDSYALISSPLRDFGKMFDLEIEKEIFPYEFYSTTNFTKYPINNVPVTEYTTYYDDPQELRDHLERLGLITTDGTVNAHLYSQHYCLLDCTVLCKGVVKFREQLREVTGLDCCDFLTLPSIAYNYLISKGVFEGCYDISAQPQHFIRKCVLGGRCMLCRNEKQDIEGDIADFDAVSLYPSAMARIYTLPGKPKIIDPAVHTLNWLKENASGFFVEVTIPEVPHHLDFPLIPHNNKHGIKEYLNEPGTFFLDDMSLDNICTFHKVSPDSITIHRGYYYDEGKNYQIRSVISELFNKRRELKAQKNPLEKIYKLLMNSCYGKSIIKPITARTQVVNETELDNILHWEASAMIAYRQAGDKYIVNTSLNILKAKSFPTFGVHVLAMSKRIMSEVMCLAQDLSIPIYYTDTDSMHLPTGSIPQLEQEFRAKYDRELIGEELGQFHTDFPSNPMTKLPTTSTHFIGVGKKTYVDKLVDPQGNVSYFTRMKGVPNHVIFKTAEEEFGNDPLALYKTLYDGNPVTFDLLRNRVSFQLNRDLTYTTRREFKRRVKF